MYDPLVEARDALDAICLSVAEDIAHEASVAAPVRTGHLSLSYDARPAAGGAEVTSGADYWAYVEYGTSRMDARPHLRPAIHLVQGQRS